MVIEETNLSFAWHKTMRYVLDKPGKEVTPLLLTLTEFDESADIRKALDNDLEKNGESLVQTVADTIFPSSLYRLAKNREDLYKMYLQILPRLKKIDSSNAKGIYFERLIAFDKEEKGKINQIERIISALESNMSIRRSKLQAAVFDPRKDHIESAYQGFPCLQHVTFHLTPSKGLVLNSVYAIQLLYRKAYGNWLGLINLGKFVANELNIDFEKLNCFIGVEQLEISKRHAKRLLEIPN